MVFLRISHPIFLSDGKKIIFFVEEHCGDLCGSGKILVYEIDKLKYRMVFEELLWISL